MTKRSSTARSYPVRIPRVAVGPLAPTVLGECAAWSAAQGYSRGSAAAIANLLARLSVWMRDVGAGVNDLDEDLLAEFVAAELSRDLPCVSVQRWTGAMRRSLASAGYLGAAKPGPDPSTPVQVAAWEWCSWLRGQRALTEKTVAAYCRYGAGLLDKIATVDGSLHWDWLDAHIVNAYVAERGRTYGVVARAHIVGSVRCLLRWALATGHLNRDLSAGILKHAGTRRSVPRGVEAEQVKALLAVCDPATAIGARDRAVVMTLVRLGLRAGEAARLRLDDIDWTNGLLKVAGKGREHTLPLPVDVGQALEAWLRLRPPALDRAVFVRLRAPRKMMTVTGFSGIIARLSDMAGIDPIRAHRLRHTAAMRVLSAGGSLTEAKELLGHVSAGTTMTYAKADLVSLRTLVVPFGQVPR